MPNTEKTTITLDGRQFAGVGQALTAVQDDYINAQLRLADAAPLVLRAQAGGDEGELAAQQLLTNILQRGLKYRIIAGIITEDGKRWSLAEAERNAEAFGQITDDSEKQLMQSEVVNLVFNFFLFATRSLQSSPSSSPASAAVPSTASVEPASLATSL